MKARRAFHTLKGIIRLQALIRGHLVRRQAVATLRCVQGIVKLQAHIRGRKVRLSVCGLEVQKGCSLVSFQVTPKLVLFNLKPVFMNFYMIWKIESLIVFFYYTLYWEFFMHCVHTPQLTQLSLNPK